MANLSKITQNSQRHAMSIQNLLASGVDPRTIGQYIAETPDKRQGNRIINTQGEVQGIVNLQKQKGITGMESLKDQKYDWDPNQYLPGIQQQSSAIYDPRIAQNEALAGLAQSQAEEQRMRTKQEFDERMKAEIEAMNRRGAYFSGGAIRGEQDIRNEQMRLLQQQDLQARASQQEMLAQRGAIGYEQQQFEKGQLFDNEASGYNRWKGERDYNYMFESNERAYATQALMGNIDAWNIRNQFNLGVDQFKLAQAQFKESSKQWDEQFAWNKFIYGQAQKKDSSSGGGGSSGLMKGGSQSIAYINQAAASGKSWSQIASDLAKKGIDVGTGSEADLELNRVFS